MKKTKTIYWIITGLFAAFMTFTAIPDILNLPDAAKFIGALGYPPYFVPFIGVAKLLGAIAIVVPGYPRIKEWAYAGLVYDLVGALYSTTSVQFDIGGVIFMLVFISVAFTSYAYYHKLQKEKAQVGN